MCDICCGEMKKPITCNICEFTACYKCFSKFILECTMNPKCMKCDKPWSRKHLVNSFGQYFVSHTYKKKREDVLFEIEKAMMPETQPLAVKVMKIRQLNNEIQKHDLAVLQLKESRTRLDVGILDSEFEEYLYNRKNYTMQIHDHQEDMRNLQMKIDRLHYSANRNAQSHKKSTLSIKCPGENCRGFVNENSFECELCKIQLCKECHEKLDNGEPLERDGSLDTHTCNPDTLETVRLLKKDSKNCPSCRSIIYKIDGCDQMFCTQCHTAFSWRTGEVSTGRIHNPHYYEYLRRSGNLDRELGDIPCGGLPRMTRAIVMNINYSRIHQRLSHFEYDEIHNLREQCNRYDGNQDLRIAYLNNDINLIDFKREIYKREKSIEKKREILAILTTCVVVGSDIFRNMMASQETENEKEILSQFESIRVFTNESLMDVSRVYKCVVPIIGKTWECYRGRHDDMPKL